MKILAADLEPGMTVDVIDSDSDDTLHVFVQDVTVIGGVVHVDGDVSDGDTLPNPADPAPGQWVTVMSFDDIDVVHLVKWPR